MLSRAPFRQTVGAEGRSHCRPGGMTEKDSTRVSASQPVLRAFGNPARTAVGGSARGSCTLRSWGSVRRRRLGVMEDA